MAITTQPALTLPLAGRRDIMFAKHVDLASISHLTDNILEINHEDEYLERLYAVHDQKYTRKPIKIYIDSYGGMVYQCFGLLSIMDNSKTPIHTIVTGTAMSCGFMILIHGHRRFGHRNSTVMYHQVSGGINGKVKDMEDEVIEAKRLQHMLECMTLTKTKISKKKLEKVFKSKKDWFIESDEAKQLGILDEIL
jgi:ATP-dependent Clp protease protease subunit